MQHPLRQARPSDPFLRLRVADEDVGAYAIDGDHVAFLRTGRRSGETWATALGDDPPRISSLIESLRPHGIDGVTVHDHVFDHLPAHLRGRDPGHWSLWEFRDSARPDATDTHAAWAPARSASDDGDSWSVERLDAHDPRIDPLLAHSDSAYIRAGDPRAIEWHGILDGDLLVAVGAWTASIGGAAHLVSICTDPAYRSRGLGRSIATGLTRRALETGATGVDLEMYAGNEAAALAYRAAGFVELGRYMSALLGGGPSTPDAEG